MTWRLHVVALVIVSLASAHDVRAEALSRQQAWALAAAAVLAERNGALHDRLAGSYLTARDADDARRVLREWWGVTDRASLLESLDGLQKRGHRERFARMGQEIAALTPAGRQALDGQRRWNLELNQKLGVVEMHYRRLGQKSLIGWDLSRSIALCRWGYAAGYLTEADAWARIIPAARIIRHTFTSWRELGENYLIGRQFWSPDEHARTGHLYREAFDRLLADASSPWNRLPWQVDFGPARVERR
jgi:hypothetical protein